MIKKLLQKQEQTQRICVNSPAEIRRWSVMYPGLFSGDIIELYDLYGPAPKEIRIRYDRDQKRYVLSG